MTKAVIFDFSGTLFRCEDTASWLRAALREAGIGGQEAEIAEAVPRLRAAGAQPGGESSYVPPAHEAQAWAMRDISARAHRSAYLARIDAAALPWDGIADVLYARNASPEAWLPYSDTAAALELLAGRGIPVVVLSNIGWDLRPVFRHHGLDPYVRDYVQSYEEGVVKPDPRIFRRACELLGHAPEAVLMVGDDPVDAGATAIGCAFRAVPHLPREERPDALLAAVNDVGRT